MDWDDVPQEKRLTQTWLLRYRKRTYLGHEPHLFEAWWERLSHPSCHRAVECVLAPQLFSPCAMRAAQGQRYCAKHGGRRPEPVVLPLRPEEAARYPKDFALVSNRTRNCLWRNGWTDIDAIRAAPDAELLTLRNFGDRCLAEVREAFGTAKPRVPAHPWWLVA